MRPDLNKIVPGLAEARAAEEAARAFAFLDVNQWLLGVAVRPLTLRAMFELAESGNMLAARCAGRRAEVGAFLWRVSVRFCRPGSLAWILTIPYRRRLRRSVAEMDPFRASEVICDWITSQRQDEPPRIEEAGDEKKPTDDDDVGFYWLASLVDFFAETYGWSQDKTLDEPIARIWQLYRANMLRHGNKVPVIPPSDRIRREWFVKMIETQRKQQNDSQKT